MESSEVAHALPEAPRDEQVLEALTKTFRLRIEDDPERRVTYYDTFDWRLHRDGGSLRQEVASGLAPAGVQSPTLCWQRRGGAQHLRLAGNEPPAFAWDFPEGPFRDALEPVVQMRRLLAVVELRLGGRTLCVLDRREKTVVRLRLEKGTVVVPESPARAVPFPTLLRVLPVRGYDKALHKVVRFVESELGGAGTSQSELERALAAIGRRAGDYVSKVVIELDPAMPAAEAAKLIHRSLLATMRRNEPGTIQDLDSEFLHDFRVAVRRTRSALSQIKGVYPEADLARFKSELRWLGGLTGPTRDLDVYLLKMDDYKAELPAAVREDLAPLSEYLVGEQRRAQRRMARSLGSDRYHRLIDAWDRFLREPTDLDAAANAGRPIVEVASRRIWKIYRRVIKEGLAIDDDTPAERVHELRIDCKKLRYLMEFFRSLYDAGRLGHLIKALKQLQDNLGDFNDFEVQQGSIREFADDMQCRGATPAATLMAMGRLVEHLEAGQARERRRVTERFAAFAAEPNQRLARQLFGSAPGP
ncbi:MAG: CHAD domain-containing protein [bacterium]|nr:CHAD domain-containing protein [bacterium]